jgi:catechol 2,3-dioxygenase-like lactoylglutathione lyase family enzyme
MLRGFATINYWTDDMEAAKRWYTELLGVEPYFQRPGPDGRLAYAEFRVGDYQHELGLVDRGWAPPGAATEPGGAVAYWHVGDIAATCRPLPRFRITLPPSRARQSIRHQKNDKGLTAEQARQGTDGR